MKRRFLALLLALVLVLPCLSGYACALTAEGWRYNSYGGELTAIKVKDAEGNYQWIDLYDGQGNLLYIPVDGDEEWEALEKPMSPAEVSAKVAARKAEIEKLYPVKLAGNYSSSTIGVLMRLNYLVQEIETIPASLRKAVFNALSKQGKTLTIGWEVNSDWAIGFYSPDRVRIDLLSIDAFAHEFGHLIEMSVLRSIYGSSTLKNMWTAQNGGVDYGNYDYQNPVFVTDYASTSWNEDFADTFDYIVNSTWEAQNLTFQYPDSTAVKKMAYLRQLLCDAFSLDSSIFPSTAPYSPSQWAKTLIEEYQSTLNPFSNSVIPSAGQMPEYSYQSGATRGRFAYSMGNDLVCSLWHLGYLSDDEFDENWSRMTSYTAVQNGALPFTDVSSDDLSYVIYSLHKSKVVNGTSPTTFNPDGLITRQEAAVMIYNLCKALNYDLSTNGGVAFTDEAGIASWAREAVSAVSAAGIMSGIGDGRFDPTGTYTNEQSAVTLLRVYKMLAATVQG